jgi:hypothetical protein
MCRVSTYDGRKEIRVKKDRIINPSDLDKESSLTLRLLDHPGLMTPRLVSAFGEIRAEQLSYQEANDVYKRHSSLRSHRGDRVVLDAWLTVYINKLPAELVSRLKSTDELFGQLLIDFEIDVAVKEPEIFRTPDGRYGRRTEMSFTNSGAIFCHVEEIMQKDAELIELVR